jgi:hypothetical protein
MNDRQHLSNRFNIYSNQSNSNAEINYQRIPLLPHNIIVSNQNQIRNSFIQQRPN